MRVRNLGFPAEGLLLNDELTARREFAYVRCHEAGFRLRGLKSLPIYLEKRTMQTILVAHDDVALLKGWKLVR